MIQNHENTPVRSANKQNRKVDETDIEIDIENKNTARPPSSQQLYRANPRQADQYRCCKFVFKAVLITIVVLGSFATGLTFVILGNKNSPIDTSSTSITCSCGGYGPQFLIVNVGGCSGCYGTVTNGTCALCTDKINNQFTGKNCTKCVVMSNNSGYCGYCGVCYPIYLSVQCYSTLSNSYQTIILNSSSCNTAIGYYMQCTDVYSSNKAANCSYCLYLNGSYISYNDLNAVGFCMSCGNCYF